MLAFTEYKSGFLGMNICSHLEIPGIGPCSYLMSLGDKEEGFGKGKPLILKVSWIVSHLL